MLDAFIGIRLEPGRHTVYMTYLPEGLKLGGLVTLGSVLVLAGLGIGGRMLRKRRSRIG